MAGVLFWCAMGKREQGDGAGTIADTGPGDGREICLRGREAVPAEKACTSAGRVPRDQYSDWMI